MAVYVSPTRLLSAKLFLALLMASLLSVQLAAAQGPLSAEEPTISGGGAMAGHPARPAVLGPIAPLPPSPLAPAVGVIFDGFDFDDNATENSGFVFIPPDSMGAAGTDRVVAVVNTMIEARTKAGVLLWRDSLADFLLPLTPANFLFDPKVVYDQYEGRFVVVALEQVEPGIANPSPGNTSKISSSQR